MLSTSIGNSPVKGLPNKKHPIAGGAGGAEEAGGVRQASLVKNWHNLFLGIL